MANLPKQGDVIWWAQYGPTEHAYLVVGPARPVGGGEINLPVWRIETQQPYFGYTTSRDFDWVTSNRKVRKSTDKEWAAYVAWSLTQ